MAVRGQLSGVGSALWHKQNITTDNTMVHVWADEGLGQEGWTQIGKNSTENREFSRKKLVNNFIKNRGKGRL